MVDAALAGLDLGEAGHHPVAAGRRRLGAVPGRAAGLGPNLSRDRAAAATGRGPAAGRGGARHEPEPLRRRLRRPRRLPAMNPRTRLLLHGTSRADPAAPGLAEHLVMLAQASIGLIETWWVSRLGTDALAGMALVFPGFMMMQMLSAGAIGGGISSAIARALGGGRREDADALVLHALLDQWRCSASASPRWCCASARRCTGRWAGKADRCAPRWTTRTWCSAARR